jgi:ferritin-like metal-binding protein YciE
MLAQLTARRLHRRCANRRALNPTPHPNTKPLNIMAISWLAGSKGRTLAVENLTDLLLAQLRDLYDAERQLVAGLASLEQAADSVELKRAAREHGEETKRHVERIEEACSQLGEVPTGATCHAVRGLLADIETVAKTDGDLAVKDAALVAGAQRVEHYEIAAYGCARALARRSGRPDVAELLDKTMGEEQEAERKLRRVMAGVLNPRAAITH